MRTTTLKHVPQWAASYLVNGDASSLDYHDKSQVDAWVAELLRKGFRILAPIDGSENEFVPYPAFGLGTSTVDFTVEILPKSKRSGHDPGKDK